VDAGEREAGHGSCVALIVRPEIDRRDPRLCRAEGIGSHDDCRGDGEEEGDRTAHASQGGWRALRAQGREPCVDAILTP